MGLQNLEGFRDRLNLPLGEKRQGNERLDGWINDAQIELFGELDLQGRRTCQTTPTVIDQREYNVPLDLLAILVLRDTTNKKRLIRTAIENFKLFDETTKGNPTRYVRVDDLIFLFPVPDTVLTLQMFLIKEPAILTAATDTSELPAMFDRVIHLLALRSALLDLDEGDRATLIFQSAQNMLRTLPTEEWLESQSPQEGIQIARSLLDLQEDPRLGVDETFQGRILL